MLLLFLLNKLESIKSNLLTYLFALLFCYVTGLDKQNYLTEGSDRS